MNTILAILLLLSVGGAVWFFFIRKKSEDPEPVETVQNTRDDLVEAKKKNLVLTAKTIALSTVIGKELQDRCFSLIDGIWEILEELNEKYPSQDVTFRINRMASGHLQELVDTFGSLENVSDTDTESFGEQIDNMQKGVNLAKEALEADDQARFDSTASFLEGMHGKN